GKSSLANAIARARGLAPVHLDQLRHLPETDWQERSDEEFQRLHDTAILHERWVMDGNYSRLLPQRLLRATGVIQLDVSTITSLFRYVRRSCFEHERIGALEGGQDSVKWDMIRHIAVTTRKNRKRNHATFDAIELPKIMLASPEDLARFYRAEGLGHYRDRTRNKNKPK
ncbi:MAG: AAA family ATPase, partial [Proteobacteria bacterium]|nr:AAA family ATPase [Pseudomonadota bacterium]